MAKGLLAGVATVDLYDNNNNLIVATRTLTDSGIAMAVTAEEARSGQGNMLIGKYYHDTGFTLTLTDQVWDLEYLALNAGGSITAGSDIMTNEQITVAEGGVITVTRDPKEFTTTSGVIGWYKLSTEADDKYKKFTFDEGAKTATLTGVAAGSIVCVKYVVTSDSARTFTVNADYIPSTVHAIMTIGLYMSGTSDEALSNSSKIGNIIVDIPRFQLDGAQDLSLTASSIASVSLSGSALAVFTGRNGCTEQGYYAIITEEIFNAGEFDNVTALAVAGGNIEIGSGETQKINVYKMYSDGTQPSLVNNTHLTFTKSGAGTHTISNDGVVTGGTGTNTVEIVATDAPQLTTACVITAE